MWSLTMGRSGPLTSDRLPGALNEHKKLARGRLGKTPPVLLQVVEIPYKRPTRLLRLGNIKSYCKREAVQNVPKCLSPTSL